MEEKKKDEVKKEGTAKKFEVVKNPETKKKFAKKPNQNKKTEKKDVRQGTKGKEEKKVETVKKEAKPEIKKEEVKHEEVKKETRFEIPQEKNKEEKPKFQKVQQQTKRKSGGKKGLVFFVFLLIIAGVIAAWFYIPEFRNLFNQNNSTSVNEENKKIEEAQEWEKAYIKVLTENYDYDNVKDFKIQLLTINEEDKIPTLVTSYANSTSKAENILDMWQADEEGEIVQKVEKCDSSNDIIKVLYNIKEEKYEWYLYLENENQKAYGSLSRLLKEAKKKNNTSQLKYNLFDYVVSAKTNLANISEENFNKQFIVVDKEDLIKTWVNYKKENSKSDILEIIKKEYAKKRTAREVVADYAKEKVLDKVEKIEKEKQGIVSGNDSLKFGTYNAKISEADEAIVVVSDNGECSYSGLAPDGSKKEIHSTGSYVINKATDGLVGINADKIVLKLKDGTNLEFVLEDNAFKNETVKFEFKNNDTKLKENGIPNESNVTENSINIINPVNTENEQKAEDNIQVPNNSVENQTKQNVNDIGKEEALKLVQKVHGTSPDGKKVGYYYLAWVKDSNENKYYAFKVAYLVDESRYTFVDTVLISADGKSYKQIVTPENFTDGQVVTKFDSEKNF